MPNKIMYGHMKNAPLLHPAWIGFIKYCRLIRNGEIHTLKIQDGLPMLAEKTVNTVIFTDRA